MLNRKYDNNMPRLHPEEALMLSFGKALAATMAMAASRHLIGEQASNCIVLAALWLAFYKTTPRRSYKNKKGGPANGHQRRR